MKVVLFLPIVLPLTKKGDIYINIERINIRQGYINYLQKIKVH